MLKKVKKDKMDKMVKKVTWSDEVIVHNIVKKVDNMLKKDVKKEIVPRPPKGPPPAQTTKMGPRPPLVPPPEHLLIEQLQWWASAPYEPKPEEPSEKDPVDQSFSIQMKPHISVDWDPYMPTDTIGVLTI